MVQNQIFYHVFSKFGNAYAIVFGLKVSQIN